MQRDDEWAAAKAGNECAGEPVRMYELGVARAASQRKHEREEEERSAPRAPAERADEPAAVGALAGMEHVHLDAALAKLGDRVLHEPAREVLRVARERRGEHDDLARLHTPRIGA